MSLPDPLLSRRSITGIHVDARALGAYLHAVTSGIMLEDMGLRTCVCVCMCVLGGVIDKIIAIQVQKGYMLHSNCKIQ